MRADLLGARAALGHEPVMPRPKHQDAASGVILLVNDRARIEEVQSAILAALAARGYAGAASFAVRLALEEAISNAFHHGHRGLPPETPVRLEYEVSPDRLVIVIEDQGPGFAPEEVPDPTSDENIELPTGRGLLLMRSFMTRIDFERGGRRVKMLYERPGVPGPLPETAGGGDRSG